MFKVDEIDPETIYLSIDAPVRENLEGLISIARVRATKFKCYVMIYHDEEQGYAVKSIDPFMFEKGAVQCPRQADVNYEEQFKSPRPFPSILIDPQGFVVVSKPSLCDSCTFKLSKTIFGCNNGNKYTELKY